jgi:hypothetical protein
MTNGEKLVVAIATIPVWPVFALFLIPLAIGSLVMKIGRKNYGPLF